MINLALKYPYLAELDTHVTASCQRADGTIAVQCGETILRSRGGGQPEDHGRLIACSSESRIIEVFGSGDNHWLALATPRTVMPRRGQAVTLHLDVARRRLLSRTHAVLHLLVEGLDQQLAHYQTLKAAIGDDAGSATLEFTAASPADRSNIVAVTQLVRSYIGSTRGITADYWPSIDDAKAAYPYWRYDPDHSLDGPIRVVHIDGISAMPCTGTHVRTTAEIGSYTVTNFQRSSDDHYRLDIRLGDSWNNWLAETW